jgi:undecaprenyl diphosphate synthase
LWPDFDVPHLEAALASFTSRERRFGLTGEQVREAARSA